MGPPQIIKVDFQLSALTTSRWLCQEIKSAGSCAPFMSTVLGLRSKLSATTVASLFGCVSSAMPEGSAPATAHAAGLVMPAFIRAAEILACCDISMDFAGFVAGESRMISCVPREGTMSVPPLPANAERVFLPQVTDAVNTSPCSATTGSGETFNPRFSESVPRMNRAFFGLMQYSSTLIFSSVETPCRIRKVDTFTGISALLENNDVLYSS